METETQPIDKVIKEKMDAVVAHAQAVGMQQAIYALYKAGYVAAADYLQEQSTTLNS